MPTAAPPRQPEPGPAEWFAERTGQALIQVAQQQSIPELTRVFGHAGLYLRPCAAAPESLSGNMLARVISLHRHAGGFAGDLRCADAEIPVASASLALVYALFVIETSDDGESLLSEIARVLKPEGSALILSLNPFAAWRARWAFNGLRTLSGTTLSALLRQHGMEVSRQRSIGPLWSLKSGVASFGREGDGVLAPFRAATLTVARRREPGMTLIRQSSPGIRLQTGVSTG